jgi:tetratricopeptide (TPR) repeat protein
VRWNPFRRSPAHSRDDQLLAQADAAEADYASGRFELAREGFAAAVEANRQELAERPDDPETVDRLAAGLNGLGRCLGKLRHFDEATATLDEALTTSRRAVELRRATAAEPHDAALARTLRTFALVRAATGVEMDEAAKALDNAMAVHMAALTATPGEEHLAEAYATELAQAELLARQGRHVEAARVADLARSGHLDDLLDMLRAHRSDRMAPPDRPPVP